MEKVLRFSIKNSVLMKKVCLLFVIILFASLFTHCTNSNKNPALNIDSNTFNKAVFFADPAGNGIRLLQPDSGNISALTNENDDFPFYSPPDNTLYFIRIYTTKREQSNKTNRKAFVFSKDLHSGKEKKLSEMLFYIPRQDRKEQIFFVDDGSKLLISPIDKECFMLDSFSGQKLPELNPVNFFPQINQYSSTDQTLFGVTDTDTYNPFISDAYNIEEVSFSKKLFIWDKDHVVKIIKEFQEEESFTNWFYGYTFSQSTDTLFYSCNQILYHYKDETHASITPGVHPFVIKNKLINSEFTKFPFFRLFRVLLLNQNEYLFAENNHLGRFVKESFHFINNNEFLGGQTRPYDPYYLFDHLTYIGSCLSPADSIMVVSTLTKTLTPDNIATGHHTPDLIKIFDFNPTEFEGTIDHTFFSVNNLFDLRMEFTPLLTTETSIPPIRVKYSATNFSGTERMQAAGRIIQWLDIYLFNESENSYEISNEEFREEFIPILDQLTAFYQNALQAKRAHRPIICEDDFKLLEKKIKQAKQIVGI